MASDDYYVDNAAGSDTNGGTSAGAAIVSGASADTDGTAVVVLSDDTPDLSGVSVGDCIYLADEGGNGIRSGDIFEITAVNDGADTVTVTPTPGSNLNQAWAIGGAWASLQKAADTVRAADTDHVWIKGGTNYTEVLNLTLSMAAATPAILEGYTASPGDNGLFTIDGEAVRANGVTDSPLGSSHYIFKNMRVTDHTSHGMDVTMDHCICKNCRFDNNGGSGVVVDDFWRFENCWFDDNGAMGCNCDSVAMFVGCRAFRNVTNGLCTDTGIMFGCVAYSNGGSGLYMQGASNVLCAIVNCTVDGDAKDTTIGINQVVGGLGLIVCINNIVYDCATGIFFSTGFGGEINVSRNNLVNANTADYGGSGATHSGEVTDPPAFETEGSDYRLTGLSPAIGAGFDAFSVFGFNPGCDIGAHQHEETGGGGLLMPNKRGNKQ